MRLIINDLPIKDTLGNTILKPSCIIVEIISYNITPQGVNLTCNIANGDTGENLNDYFPSYIERFYNKESTIYKQIALPILKQQYEFIKLSLEANKSIKSKDLFIDE